MGNIICVPLQLCACLKDSEEFILCCTLSSSSRVFCAMGFTIMWRATVTSGSVKWRAVWCLRRRCGGGFCRGPLFIKQHPRCPEFIAQHGKAIREKGLFHFHEYLSIL